MKNIRLTSELLAKLMLLTLICGYVTPTFSATVIKDSEELVKREDPDWPY